MKTSIARSFLALVCLIAAACSEREADWQKYVEAGDRFQAEKRYAEAIVEYRNAIKADGNRGEARYKLANAYEATGDAQRAYRELVRAADLLPSRTDVQLHAARFLIRARQFEDAKTRAQGVLAREPKNIDALLIRANATAGLKDLDGALKELQQVAELEPTRGLTHTNLALLRLARGQQAEAKAAFEKAVEVDPKSAPAWLALANFQLLTGAPADAEASVSQAIQADSRLAPAHQLQAAIFLTTKRVAEAEQPLKTVIAITQSPDAKFALVNYYLATRRGEEGRSLLRTLQRDKGTGAQATVMLADIEYNAKQTAIAHNLIDTLLKSEPSNVPALVVKARWLAQEGRIEEALKRAHTAVAADRNVPSAHFVLGSLQMQTRDIDGAIASFSEVLKLNPRAAAAEVNLANLYLAKGEEEKALLMAESAVQAGGGTPVSRLALARALLASGDIARADTEVGGLLKEYPNVAAVRVVAGNVLLAKNQRSAARAEFERAMKLAPGSFEALRGMMAVDMGTPNQLRAVALMETRLAAEPDDANVQMLAGRVFALSGNLPRAEQALREAIRLMPDDPIGYALLAQVYVAQDKLDEARKEFEAVLKKNPRDAATGTMIGMILEAQKKVPEALKTYNDVIAAHPRAAVAANNAAYIYAERRENLDSALKLAQTAVDVMPKRPEVHDTLGWVYYQKELPLLAVEPFKTSIAQDGANPVYHYHLALAYAKIGETGKAREAAHSALKLRPDYAEAQTLLQSIPR